MVHEALDSSISPNTTPLLLLLLEGGERERESKRREREKKGEFYLSMVVQAYNLGTQNQKLEAGESGIQDHPQAQTNPSYIKTSIALKKFSQDRGFFFSGRFLYLR